MKSNSQPQIKLKKVEKSDHRFLFNLLKNRPPEVNISNRKIPTYSEHVQFVLSQPYSKWYIILYKDKKIGSIYLSKQNEIGIFLEKEFQNKGIGKIALNLLKVKNPKTRYLANINPKNKSSSKFFKKNGFKLIQYTYELLTPDNYNNEKKN